MRALYGDNSFPCGPLPVRLAHPSNGCGSIRNAFGLGSLEGALVVTLRGGCSFEDKAMNVQAAGGVGILVVNGNALSLERDSAPLFRMPAS